MILLDSSGLVAAYDRGSREHQDVVRILSQPQRRILSPFVLAELDYLITHRVGDLAARRMLSDVTQGAFELVPLEVSDVTRALHFIRRYEGLRIGLTDASIIVLAERYECHNILTLDQRHFRAIVAHDGDPFRLLPFDGS